MKPFKNLTPEEQAGWLVAHGERPYRRRQLEEWMYSRWVLDFAEMTNLPQALRDALATDFLASSLTLVQTQQAGDGTRKFLFRLQDGETIETVLIPAPRRNTVCVSTQVGCPVHCVFCASGQSGFVRNLTPAEIIDQVVVACRELGERVNNIVVMGMGEPLLNLDHLETALGVICSPDRLGFGARHITISTSGIVPGIRRLSELGRQWNLAISLHAATETARARLIPATHRYPLLEIVAACKEYREKGGRMVTFEYALIKGENNASGDVDALAKIARELHAKVNLIPVNATGPGIYTPPDRAAVKRFADGLEKKGVQVSVRREMGTDIRAACGQLRRATGT